MVVTTWHLKGFEDPTTTHTFCYVWNHEPDDGLLLLFSDFFFWTSLIYYGSQEGDRETSFACWFSGRLYRTAHQLAQYALVNINNVWIELSKLYCKPNSARIFQRVFFFLIDFIEIIAYFKKIEWYLFRCLYYC
jgi:hypothetical protein